MPGWTAAATTRCSPVLGKVTGGGTIAAEVPLQVRISTADERISRRGWQPISVINSLKHAHLRLQIHVLTHMLTYLH